MIVIGLTGSIAMGKSETAKLFAGFDIPLFDSDAEVHRLYGLDGEAVVKIAELAPEAIVGGSVDRAILAAKISKDPTLLSRVEAIVHPLVRHSERRFLARCKKEGRRAVVMDVPLLFETGREDDFDAIVVVSAPSAIQRKRALERPGMTEDKLDYLLGRQLPDEEKRRRADFIVDSSKGKDAAREEVAAILRKLGIH